MSYIFFFIFPWLVMLWLGQALMSCLKISLSQRASLGCAIAALGIVVVPVGGIPLGRWFAGLNLQPSLPLLALLAGQIWKNGFQQELLRPKDTAAGWIFGAVMGTLLYPAALGWGNFDPYSLGWSASILFPIVALLTIFLVWKQNRFSLLLVLSILAYDLRLLESPNFWDYLVDPIYWLLSIIMLTIVLLKKLCRRRTLATAKSACTAANAR